MVWLMGIAAVKMGCYWFFSGFDMHAFLLLREPEKDSSISNLEFLLMCALGIGYSLGLQPFIFTCEQTIGKSTEETIGLGRDLKE